MSEDTKATIEVLEHYWQKGGFYEIPTEIINTVIYELEEKDKESERLNNIIKELEIFLFDKIEHDKSNPDCLLAYRRVKYRLEELKQRVVI